MVQPKLVVGSASDPLESEADAFADRVMRMSDPSPPPAPVQQKASARREDRVTLRRQPASAASPPQQPSLDDQWSSFEKLRTAGKTQEALDVARSIAPILSYPEALVRGRDLAFWLMDQKEWDLAKTVLANMKSAKEVGFAATKPPAMNADDPQALLDRGKTEAAAGHDEQAFVLLGMSALFVQMALKDTSDAEEKRWQKQSDEIQGSVDKRIARADSQASFMGGPAMTTYMNVKPSLDLLRSVLRVYPDLQRAAAEKGDTKAAEKNAALAAGLEKEIGDKYSLADARVLTMVLSLAANERGQTGYKLNGVTNPKKEEVVTPLPGTKSVDDLGNFPTLGASTKELVTAIGAQERLLATLAGNPEVQKVFGKKPIDMNSLADRIKVWAAMFKTFQKDQPSPLAALLQLVQQHLTGFTGHTDYNVRDFGESYLTSQMPTDVAGRAARDCGVYALTVAYEVFRTARDATPRLPVQFRLFVMPEHVALGIFDGSTGTFFVVNNDKISGGKPGKPDDLAVTTEVAKLYGETVDRKVVAAPFLQLGLGSTDIADPSFKTNAWQTYQAATTWRVGPGRSDDEKRPEDERQHDVYKDYYDATQQFTGQVLELRNGLDQLSGTAAGLEPEKRKTLLAQKLPDILGKYGVPLGKLLDALGPHAQTSVDPSSKFKAKFANQKADYLLFLDKRTAGDAHPMARIGMAILHLKSLGGDVDGGDMYLKKLGGIPLFAEALKSYEAAGKPARF